MKQVGLLTEQQMQELYGKWFIPDNLFNPIQDIDDNWVISTQEINQCENPDFMWVKNLPLIDYKLKPLPPIPGT